MVAVGALVAGMGVWIAGGVGATVAGVAWVADAVAGPAYATAVAGLGTSVSVTVTMVLDMADAESRSCRALL